jgi:hypothetical protein
MSDTAIKVADDVWLVDDKPRCGPGTHYSLAAVSYCARARNHIFGPLAPEEREVIAFEALDVAAYALAVDHPLRSRVIGLMREIQGLA